MNHAICLVDYINVDSMLISSMACRYMIRTGRQLQSIDIETETDDINSIFIDSSCSMHAVNNDWSRFAWLHHPYIKDVR